MPPLIAKGSVMPKFQKMTKISYREEVDKVDSPHSCTLPGCTSYATSRDGVIDIKRWKRDTGIQCRHEKKEDIAGFILKPIARPEYGTVYVTAKLTSQILIYSYPITSFERSRSENT